MARYGYRVDFDGSVEAESPEQADSKIDELMQKVKAQLGKDIRLDEYEVSI